MTITQESISRLAKLVIEYGNNTDQATQVFGVDKKAFHI
jgi:hypothetical protein